MPFPPTTDTSKQVTRKAIHNIAVGLVATYAVTFGICVLSQSAATAAGLAALPSLFAAPFVGGIVTVVSYSRVHKTVEPVEPAEPAMDAIAAA